MDGKPLAYSADMRDVAAIGAVAQSIEADHGPVDIIVACQGTTVIKPMLEVGEAEYDTVIDTNLKSVFFSCQEFGRRMVELEELTGAAIYLASPASGFVTSATLRVDGGYLASGI